MMKIFKIIRVALFGAIFCIATLHLSVESTELENVFSPKENASNIDNTITPNASPVDPFLSCPNFGGLQVAGSVFKCYCQGQEIYVNGKCQHYDETIVHVQKDWIFTVEARVSNYNITVQDVRCDLDRYRSFNFTKGQFHLRPRGDMVLLQGAGELDGQRINNYCLIHHLDDHGDLTWTMKACVPIPSIPRCCPHGYAMKEGNCHPAKTPKLLTPPISAKPVSGKSVKWPNVSNYYNKLVCKSEPMTTIPLSFKQSALISLADGVKNVWVPEEFNKRRVYYSCPNFCVDGVENSDGSVDYFTSFCYQDPREAYEKACRNGPCIHKCCKHGYSMDSHSLFCLPDVNSTFSPPVANDLSSYNIVIGYPLCQSFIHKTEGITIDISGRLVFKDRAYPSSDFCVDTFLKNGFRQYEYLTCRDKPSAWIRLRPILFAVCKCISLVFLSITIACHLFVPELLANEGFLLLCYAVSMFIAFASSFSVIVYDLDDYSCVNLAIAMQFGFLATFFWLNVMCFDIWRKIRGLVKNEIASSCPSGVYVLYGWGIPLCISIITIAMQNLAPDNVKGIIKPYIGTSQCWFLDDISTFLYFYGPVAFVAVCSSVFIVLTLKNYKALLRDFVEKTIDRRNTEDGAKNEIQNSPKSPPPHVTRPIQDFYTKLKLFAVMALCWVTEILSWKIPPLELWALTDILNALQGLFIFIIFLLNRHKRAILKEKFPRMFDLLRCQKLRSKSSTKQTNKSQMSQDHENTVVSTITD